MVSDRHLEANKTNAQKSIGPQTPEGRAAVRLNGVKHGLTARTIVLQDESLTYFEDLLDAVQAEHQPATPTEEALVRQIAMAIWRLLRSYHTEGGFLTIRRIRTKDPSNCDDALDKACQKSYYDYSNGTGALC